MSTNRTIIRVRSGHEPEAKSVEVKQAGEQAKQALQDRAVASCFLCQGVRYIPVTERAEIGPEMFDAASCPDDWACCPECNAGGIEE